MSTNGLGNGQCELCGSRHLKHLLDGQDRLHGTPGIFPVVQCQECSLAFLHPQPSLKDIPGFYPKFYYAYVDEVQPKQSFFKRLELQFRERKKAEILTTYYHYPRRFPKNIFYSFVTAVSHHVNDVPDYIADGVLLDIGCGKGAYLQEMEKLGWKTLGVEFSDSGVQAARQAGLDVMHGSIEDADFRSGCIDYARMADVLEHLPNPLETMTEVHRILKPGGMIQISLPNIHSFTFWLFGQYWFPLEIPRHLFFYSPKSLRLLASTIGFDIKTMKVWSHKEVDVIFSIEYWLHAKHPHLEKFFQNKLFRKLIRKALYPAKAIATFFGYGSAITILMRKKIT